MAVKTKSVKKSSKAKPVKKAVKKAPAKMTFAFKPTKLKLRRPVPSDIEIAQAGAERRRAEGAEIRHRSVHQLELGRRNSA